MQPHQQRVVDEKRELDEKIEKLAAFFNTEIYRGLRSADQSLLSKQLHFMTGYSEVLRDRISLF